MRQMVVKRLSLELFVLNEDFAPQKIRFPQSAQADAQQRAQLAAQQNPDILRHTVSGQRADVFQRRNRPDKQNGGQQQEYSRKSVNHEQPRVVKKNELRIIRSKLLATSS